jgi:monovalent cation/proton antiporter MnhG/PhaG subunit
MRNLVVGVLLMAGALLSLLAAVGLVKFPDVLTRMHAAAKAATVGVILVTAAAVLAVEGVGDSALLLLVVLLLFLSGPVATTLLGRSAYHDPGTEGVIVGRDDLAGQAPEEPAFDDRPGSWWLLAVWVTAVWAALWGVAEPGVALGAAALGITLALLLPAFRPRWPHGVLHPVAALRWALHLGREMLVSTWQVARAVVSPTSRLRTAVIRVPLRVQSATEVTLLMNTISFTPGTISLEVEEGMLYVHVLHLASPQAFIDEVRTLEGHIIAAFGTPEARAELRAGRQQEPDDRAG